MPFMPLPDKFADDITFNIHSTPIQTEYNEDVPSTIDIDVDDTRSAQQGLVLVRRMRTVSIRQEPYGASRRVQNTVYELSPRTAKFKASEVNGQTDSLNPTFFDPMDIPKIMLRSPLQPTHAYNEPAAISYHSPTRASLQSKSCGVSVHEEASTSYFWEQRRSWRFYVCITGLLLLNLTCGYSITAIATALPAVAQTFNATAARSFWIPGSYLLTATLSQPLIMRVSHITGCKPLLLFGGLIFTSMPLIPAMCNNGSLTFLLVSQSIGGVGLGAIRTLTPLLIAQIVAGHDSSCYNKYISLAFWLGATAAPIFGGLLTEQFHWQSIFWIQAASGTAGFLSLVFLPMPSIETGSLWRRIRRVDYLNWLLLAASIMLIAGATSWAAVTISWKAWQTRAPLVLGLAGLTLWSHRVHRASEPILTVGIFRDVNATAACFSVFAQNFLFAGAVYLMPIYLGAVRGLGASEAGLRVLSWTLAMLTASCIATSVPPAWSTRFAPSSCALNFAAALAWLCIIIGMASTIQLIEGSATKLLTFNAVLVGSGLGVLTPTLSAIVQTATTNDDETIHAVSLHSFFTSLGHCFGVLLCGSTFLTQLRSYLAVGTNNSLDMLLYVDYAVSNIAGISSTRESLPAAVANGYTNAFAAVWWFVLYVLAVLACIATMLLVRRVRVR